MSDVVIRAEGLGKKFLIGHNPDGRRYVALRDVLVRGARTFLRTGADLVHGRPIVSGQEIEEFWALRNLDFEVKRGDVVGVIGRNGAGKSTLLKVLSRITDPSEGRVEIEGRVASLLEVGTGFHPELTGRENIFLNGAILGMGRAEIRRKFDEIVDFAEVERFLDTPVKRYSSGMYTRLAFAVAAHLEPEILVVDEVLSVGDADFQEKSRGKMTDVAREGRTILFVSHNLSAVTSLCTRAMLLDRGQLRVSGSPQEVIAEYRHVHDREALTREWQPDDRVNTQQDSVRLRSVRVEGLGAREELGITLESEVQLSVAFDNLVDGQNLNISVHVYMADSVCAFNTWSEMKPFKAGRIEGICRIPAHFLNAHWYRVGVLLVQQGTRVLLNVDDAISFEVREFNRVGAYFGPVPGAVRPHFDWTMTETSA